MKIIDIKKKGNVVRFILGKNDLTDWYGDDWDDTPYEHNCGEVYEEFVEGYKDLAFPFDFAVYEPADDWRFDNTPYCRNDFKARKVPCLIIAPLTKDAEYNSTSYYELLNRDDVKRIYFGDSDSIFDKIDGVWLSCGMWGNQQCILMKPTHCHLLMFGLSVCPNVIKRCLIL